MKFALLGAATFLAAMSAHATCVPPPPDAFSNSWAGNVVPQRVGDDAKLPLRRPLTDAGIDYLCPMPVELGIAYRVFNYQSNAVVHALMDEQMVQADLPTTAGPSAPAWNAAATYQQGERTSHGGVTYQAQWWTQGEEPGVNTSGVWQSVIAGEVVLWSSTRPYQTGEKAIFSGKVWQARWWSLGEQPGSNEWGAWLQTADPLPRQIALPSRYSARLGWSGGELTVTVQSVNGALSGKPAYLEVREQGTALGRIGQFPILYQDCFGIPGCQGGAYWTGYGKFPTTKLPGTAWISLWACNSQDVCRPAELTRQVLGQTTSGHLSEPVPLEGNPQLAPQ
ncbi:carbohydrate-binding protein [Jeongeupia naejangsanensis]|nr:carbohydrate-binding protein [Jeongeupia naejangsanensis]